MKLIEFVDKWIGKKCDYDGFYGAQCVDLFRMFCKEVLNIPFTGGVEGAKDLYLNYDKMPLEQKYFNRFPPAVDMPCPGDAIIYGATPTNQYGHVAIVLYPCPMNVIVIEQNGITQAGTEVKIRNYINELGYLRFKGSVQ